MTSTTYTQIKDLLHRNGGSVELPDKTIGPFIVRRVELTNTSVRFQTINGDTRFLHNLMALRGEVEEGLLKELKLIKPVNF